MALNDNPLGQSTLIPITLMVVYFISCMLSIANYSGWVRFKEDLYGEDFLRAYLAFTVLGTVDYFLISGMMWLWAAKYTDSASARVSKISYGMYGIFLFHELPIYIMEYHAVLSQGWQHAFFGFVFVIHYMTWIVAFVFTWVTYAWTVARYLESTFGSGPTLKTGQEVVNILPPASVASRSQSQAQNNNGAAGLGVIPMASLQKPMLDTKRVSEEPMMPIHPQPMSHARGLGGVYEDPAFGSPTLIPTAGGNRGSMHRAGSDYFVGPASPSAFPPTGPAANVNVQWSPRDRVEGYDEIRPPSTRGPSNHGSAFQDEFRAPSQDRAPVGPITIDRRYI